MVASTEKEFKLSKTCQGSIHYYWKNGISNGHPTHTGILSDRVFEINEEILAFASRLCNKNQASTLRIDFNACTQFEVIAFISENESEIDEALTESISFLSKYSEIIPV